QLTLEPNERFNDPYEFDMAGLMVTADGGELRTFRVYYVVAGSPASGAGVKEGDIITALNGQSAAELSLERIRRLFRQGIGNEHRLVIEREGRSLDVTLRLRRLI